jgi:spore germination protein YaaH
MERPSGVWTALAACVLMAQLVGAAPVSARQPAGVPSGAPAAPAAAPSLAQSDAPAGDSAELLPGIHYEDALAHADDRIEFTPGGRVTVGFRPRADDTWEVGGRSPRALPAGSAAGRDLLPAKPVATAPKSSGNPEPAPSDDAAPSPDSSPSASQTAPPAATAPVDRAAVGPSEAPAADGASATMAEHPPAVSLDGTRLRRQVMGFLPYWEVNDARLDYELLSTIAYFSVGADKNGNLLKLNSDGTPTTGWKGWTSSRLTTIINAAHAKGTRVVLTISVFAWSSGQAALQGALLGNPTARLNLARQAAAAVRARGADGINLDFEPIASGYADEYTAFVRTVRAELNKQAPGYQLTFDTTGYIGNYPIEAATAPGGADAIFIMGYDYRTAGATYAGSIDPLAGPGYDLRDTVNAYAARVAPSKLILGVPWYGRAWSTVSDQVNARTQSGTKFGSSNSVLYDTAADYAKQHGRRWDGREHSPWVAYRRQNCSTVYGCVMSWRQIYYDDAQSLKLRYDLINRMGLRGAGIWALGYDADRVEMRQAIAEKFLNDRTSPLAGIRTLAPSQTSESFNVSWIGSDESGVRDYDLQVSINGGPWHDWLIDTTAMSGSYTGADGYGFAFRVRARDTHGNVGAWDVSSVYTSQVGLAIGNFAKVVAPSVNVRSAASTTAAIVTTAAAGTILAITGGPLSNGGYTWYKVTLPISEWAPVAGVRTDVWVAAGDGSGPFIAACGAPNSTAVDLPAGVAPTSGARFVGMNPVRLLDTRSGVGLSGSFASGVARTFAVAGRGGVPTNAVAVSGTLTVVGQSSAGYASLGPSTATVARSSVVNAPRGDVRASGVSVKLGAGGTLAALWSGAVGSRTSLIFDVSGYFVPGTGGATYVPLTPARLLDTRTGNGLSGVFTSDTPRTFAVRGRGAIPAGAVAVTGNLTVVGPSSGGYLYIGPVAASTPPSSSLNVLKGDTRAASVTVKLDGSGRLGVVWKGAPGARAHVLFDVTGYFVNSAAGAAYYPLDAARLLDTRVGNGLTGVFTRNVVRAFQSTGRGTIPVNAVAVTGGATVVVPSASGWLIVGPSGTPLGATSTINLPKGDIRANGLTVRAGAGGGLGAVFRGSTGASANVIFDATGYFR